METADILKDILANCGHFRHYGPALILFKASVPTEENLVFGVEVSVDLMSLNEKTVLHVIDTVTKFSPATFLDAHGINDGQSSEEVRIALME